MSTKKSTEKKSTLFATLEAMESSAKLDKPRKVYADHSKGSDVPRNPRVIFGGQEYGPPGGVTDVDTDETVRIISWQLALSSTDAIALGGLEDLPVAVGRSHVVVAQPSSGAIERWEALDRVKAPSKAELLARVAELENKLKG